MNDDKILGIEKKFEGSAQKTIGKITGDQDMQAEGDAKKAAGSVRKTLGDAEDYVTDSLDTLKTYINEKPVQSSFIALAIGLVLGKLLTY